MLIIALFFWVNSLLFCITVHENVTISYLDSILHPEIPPSQLFLPYLPNYPFGSDACLRYNNANADLIWATDSWRKISSVGYS